LHCPARRAVATSCRAGHAPCSSQAQSQKERTQQLLLLLLPPLLGLKRLRTGPLTHGGSEPGQPEAGRAAAAVAAESLLPVVGGERGVTLLRVMVEDAALPLSGATAIAESSGHSRCMRTATGL
jgi:hypothetical protein